MGLLVVLVAGGILVEPIELGRRGIVVGMSIDLVAEGYLVAVQLVSVAADSKEGKASAYTVVEGTGPTVSQAMDSISYQASLMPSYGHCKVLFLGEDTLTEIDGILVNFLRNDILTQDTQIVAVQGTGKEALSAKVPLLDSSSAYVEQDNMLVSQTGGRNLVSLKDYCAKVKGEIGAKLLPYAVKIKAQPADGEQQKQDEAVLFDLYNTVAYSTDGVPHIYGHQVTRGVGLVNAKGGQVTAYDREGRYVTVKLLTVVKTRSYTPDTIKATYRYAVSVVESTLPAETPEKEIATLVATEIDREMEYAYQTALKDDVDLFAVAGRLYCRYGTKLSLSQVKWERTIKVTCH